MTAIRSVRGDDREREQTSGLGEVFDKRYSEYLDETEQSIEQARQRYPNLAELILTATLQGDEVLDRSIQNYVFTRTEDLEERRMSAVYSRREAIHRDKNRPTDFIEASDSLGHRIAIRYSEEQRYVYSLPPQQKAKYYAIRSALEASYREDIQRNHPPGNAPMIPSTAEECLLELTLILYRIRGCICIA